MAKTLTESERERAARIVALFSMLIHAWITNAFADAEFASRELRNAGILIGFQRSNEREVSRAK